VSFFIHSDNCAHIRAQTDLLVNSIKTLYATQLTTAETTINLDLLRFYFNLKRWILPGASLLDCH